MKKFKFIAVILCMMLAFSFVACGNSEPPVTDLDYTVDFNQNATLTGSFNIIIPSNVPENKKITALIDGFKEKYPLVEIKTRTFNSIQSVAAYTSTIVQQKQVDMLPEIIWTNSEFYYALVANGAALPLDKLMAQATEAGLISADDFTDDFNASGFYQGVRYALPRSTDSIVTFYNKELLADAGVDTSVIKDGWTWEDLMSVCATLRTYYDQKPETSNYYPLDANFIWEPVAYSILRSLGVEIINSEGKFAMTEQDSLIVWNFMQELIEKRYVPARNDAANSFESGTGPLLFQSAGADNYQSRASHKDKFDIVSFPLISGENSKIGQGFAGYAINPSVVNDQNKLNMVGLFTAYLLSEEGQQKFAQDGGSTLPSIRKDLSIDNPDANWHSVYPTINMGAYVWGSQYKQTVDFLNNVEPTMVNDLVSALNSYVGSNCLQLTNAEAYTRLQRAVESAFNSDI